MTYLYLPIKHGDFHMCVYQRVLFVDVGNWSVFFFSQWLVGIGRYLCLLLLMSGMVFGDLRLLFEGYKPVGNSGSTDPCDKTFTKCPDDRHWFTSPFISIYSFFFPRFFPWKRVFSIARKDFQGVSAMNKLPRHLCWLRELIMSIIEPKQTMFV